MASRISNNQLTRTLLLQVQQQMAQQAKLFEQISTNKKIVKASDDPTGASQAMVLRTRLEQLNEEESVIKRADAWTNSTSVSLDSALSTWKRVNEIAISAADGTKTAADRQGMAEELEQLRAGRRSGASRRLCPQSICIPGATR